MKKIATGLIVVFATFAMVWAGAVGGADYPTKRLTYIICFNPGGESDITARFQEQPLKKYFGQDVIITYKVGGGGALGWSELVQAKPDGYTIAGHNLPHTILCALFDNYPKVRNISISWRDRKTGRSGPRETPNPLDSWKIPTQPGKRGPSLAGNLFLRHNTTL